MSNFYVVLAGKSQEIPDCCWQCWEVCPEISGAAKVCKILNNSFAFLPYPRGLGSAQWAQPWESPIWVISPSRCSSRFLCFAVVSPFCSGGLAGDLSQRHRYSEWQARTRGVWSSSVLFGEQSAKGRAQMPTGRPTRLLVCRITGAEWKLS